MEAAAAAVRYAAVQVSELEAENERLRSALGAWVPRALLGQVDECGGG